MPDQNPFLSTIRSGAPGTLDAIQGQRGSTQMMAGGFAGGMHHLGGQWVNPWTGIQAGHMANAMGGAMMGGGFHGQGAERMGQTFEELARRGLNTGMNQGMGGVAGNLQQWSGAMSAAQNAFGMMGNANPSTPQMMDLLQGMTSGGLSSMSPMQVEMMTRRAMNVGGAAGMNPGQMLGAIGVGGQMAQAHGLDQTFGAQLGTASVAFGQAFGRQGGGGGFGGLDRGAATQLDMQMRAGAAKSQTANMMGSLIAMKQAGLLGSADKPTDAYRMAERIMNGNVSEFKDMKPGEFMAKMKASGVDAGTARQFLNAREANQEQISQFGIQDKVRGMQGGELDKFAERALSTSLRVGGMSAGESRSASSVINEELKNMSRFDKGLLTDPDRAQERNTILASKLGMAGIDMNQDQLAKAAGTAVRNLQGVASRSNFGNLAGMIDMNRGDIHEEQGAGIAAADQKAAAQKALAAVGQGNVFTRIVQAVQNAAQGAPEEGDRRAADTAVNPKAPDGQGGNKNGDNINISGVLTVKGDGSGNLEGKGVAAPR